MDMTIVEFGPHFLRLRAMRGLTQTAMANAAGLNRVTVANIENGNTFRMSTAITLLRALDPPLTDQERAETSKILGIHADSLVFASVNPDKSVEDRMVALLKSLGPEVRSRISIFEDAPHTTSDDPSHRTLRSIESIVRQLVDAVGPETAEGLLSTLAQAVAASTKPAADAASSPPDASCLVPGASASASASQGVSSPLRMQHPPIQKRTPDGKPYVEQQITEAERLAAERAASRRAKPLPRDREA